MTLDGLFEVSYDGCDDFSRDGKLLCLKLGCILISLEGFIDGEVLGFCEGGVECNKDGKIEGSIEGARLGFCEGGVECNKDGKIEGSKEGARLGMDVGCTVYFGIIENASEDAILKIGSSAALPVKRCILNEISPTGMVRLSISVNVTDPVYAGLGHLFNPQA